MKQKCIISSKGSLFFYADVDADEAVVFSADSGDTHLIDPLSASLLEEIDKQPKTKADLVKYGLNLLNETQSYAVENFIDEWQIKFKNMELIDVGEKK